jgi:hypothetical protein
MTSTSGLICLHDKESNLGSKSQSPIIHMLSALFTRAKVIYQTEGLLSVLSRGLRFLVHRYDTYYIYKHTMKERNEADFMPKIQDFTLKIVFTNQQADDLAVAMGVDFRSYSNNAKRRLDKGAIAFCIFVENEIANISWVAMTQEAKDTFDSLPYRVFFSDKEACLGGDMTIPKYRGKNLGVYGIFRRVQYLREKGIIVSRSAVLTSNIASQKMDAKFGSEIIAKFHKLVIFKFTFYKETPLPSPHA